MTSPPSTIITIQDIKNILATTFHAVLDTHRHIYGPEADAEFIIEIPDRSSRNLRTEKQFLATLRQNQTGYPACYFEPATTMAQRSAGKQGHAKTETNKKTRDIEGEAIKIVAELRERIEAELRPKIEVEIRERIEAERTEKFMKKMRREFKRSYEERLDMAKDPTEDDEL
ncbi:uncharacterized protein PAC_12412 [Phialocephala subalpina]|uniref:Uncharacterized protein n=1 Tax=Phialocephala subalpina TaxID=576137 RepID=A0A1L7XBY2_9HELO|nr:uncharacterized protein PAC_12412 [Phialocephala subalpina]